MQHPPRRFREIAQKLKKSALASLFGFTQQGAPRRLGVEQGTRLQSEKPLRAAELDCSEKLIGDLS
jgi:hypothetical protein